MPQTAFIHHAARCGVAQLPSTLSGVAACLEAGAPLIEVDIQPLADGDYALLHDALLEEGTTGRGPVATQTAAGLQGIYLRQEGRATLEPVALLSQVVELVREQSLPQELQLDLKAHLTAPLTDDRLRALLRLLEPLRGRVRVSSTADWALRRLHALAPWLDLGFDPLLYLDRRAPDGAPPCRTGAYGYRDDHPLAVARWGEARDYLAERAEALWAQMPAAGVWYIRGLVLSQALDDGFDWIGYLHRRGALVAAWTLDAARPGDVELARRLVGAGVDRITTNDASALARALSAQAW